MIKKIKLTIALIAILILTSTTLVFAGGGGGGGGGDAAAGNTAAAMGIGFAGITGGAGSFGGITGGAGSSGGNSSSDSTDCSSNPESCGGCEGGSGGGGGGDVTSPTITLTPTPICSPIQGSACQSTPNTCGGTSSGTIACNGTCSAITPANPAYYGTACTSAQNSCFEVGHGTIDCDNVCTATVPDVSTCPISCLSDCNPDFCVGADCNPDFCIGSDCDPVACLGSDCTIVPPTSPNTSGFYTSDHIYFVMKNGTKTLVWGGIQYATQCTVSGPDSFSSSYSYTEEQSINSNVSGIVETPPIEHRSDFTLTCQNGDGPTAPSASVNLTILLIPIYQDI